MKESWEEEVNEEKGEKEENERDGEGEEGIVNVGGKLSLRLVK